jgi:hypothetical protein
MIAYLILVHRYPDQFKRMFKAIHHPLNHYLIHVDKSSGDDLSNNIQTFLQGYKNAELLEPEKALWGGYSLVNIELRGMAQLLKKNKNWTHFINLSGQDFPLKTQKFIRNFLISNPGKEYIHALDQLKMRPDTMNRIHQMCFEFGSKIFRPNISRKFLKGIKPYIGTQWMIVSRRFCEFVTTSKEVDRYKKFYRNSFIADESFFQTIMMNNDCHGEIVQNDLRQIDWIPDGDIKLRPRTFTSLDTKQLISSHNLFARKFDCAEDGLVLDEIEIYLNNLIHEAETHQKEINLPYINNTVPEMKGEVLL